MPRTPEEINSEYQAAAAALGQAAYHKAKLEGQIAHLAQRMAQLEDEHGALANLAPEAPAPKKGEKAAKRRAAALAKAKAKAVKVPRGRSRA